MNMKEVIDTTCKVHGLDVSKSRRWELAMAASEKADEAAIDYLTSELSERRDDVRIAGSKTGSSLKEEDGRRTIRHP